MSKFKILKDYQLTTDDKKILILKSKVFIVDYVYVNKDISVTLDPLLVENNPEYFQFIDWKTDFINFLKTNKIAQPSVIAKKLFPYIEENFKSDELVSCSTSDDSSIALIDQKYKDIINAMTDTNLLESNNKDKEYLDVVSSLKMTNESLEIIISDMSDEMHKLNLVLSHNKNSGESIEKSYQDQITKLELKLSSMDLKKSKYTQEVEEEMISKLKEVNERMEAVIKREGEVRTLELDSANALRESIEINEQNNLKLIEIESNNKMLELKINDINTREKQIQSTDINQLIEKAIIEYEKGIPWQYHQKRN